MEEDMDLYTIITIITVLDTDITALVVITDFMGTTTDIMEQVLVLLVLTQLHIRQYLKDPFPQE